MRAENKKMVLLIALAAIAPLAEVIVLLDINLRRETGLLSFYWLTEIGFFRWGWILVFVFAGITLIGAICWKFENILLKGIIIIISVIAFVLALPWFLLRYFKM